MCLASCPSHLTYRCALRTYVFTGPTCLCVSLLRTSPPFVCFSFLRALRAFNFTCVTCPQFFMCLPCLHFVRALILLLFYVPSFFTCLTCLHFLRAYISFKYMLIKVGTSSIFTAYFFFFETKKYLVLMLKGTPNLLSDWNNTWNKKFKEC